MFKGYLGLALDGDHLDISFRDADSWPNLLPSGSIKSYAFDIGDPVAGPTVLLGINKTVEGEVLDWQHSIDPVHHHGTDQFRAIVGGDWILAGKPMPPGSYGFQEAGWVYQEHPGEKEPGWNLLVMGDRRGTRATLKLKRDAGTVIDAGAEMNEAFGAPPNDDSEYPHPAGDKGLAAVVTTLGPCERGYLTRRCADLGTEGTPPAVTGLLGDETAGPVVHVLKAGANAVVLPACSYPTELVFVVMSGSCRIGADELRAGDLRAIRADAALDRLDSGPDGVELVMIVADRRARPSLPARAAPAWVYDAERLLADLTVVPGGVEGHRQRMAMAGTA